MNVIEKLKLKFNSKILIYLFISIVFFGNLLILEFAQDTYSVLSDVGENLWTHFASLGRYLTGVIVYLLLKFQIPEGVIYFLSYLCSIIALTLSMFKIDKYFSKIGINKIIVILLSSLIIINVFSIELFLFLEKGILILSILFSICAFENMLKYFEKKEKKYLVLVVVYEVLANVSYQGTIGIFFVLTSIDIIRNTKGIKDFFSKSILAGVIYVVIPYINILLMKYIFGGVRVEGNTNILKAITNVIPQIKQMVFETFYIFDKNIYIIALAVAIVLILISIIINFKYEEKTKSVLLKKMLGWLYIILVIMAVSIAPQLLQKDGNVFLAPRSTYPFAMSLGILLIYPYLYKQKYKIINILTVITALAMIIYQINIFSTVIHNRYIVTYLDLRKGQEVCDSIGKYEDETGNKIKYLSVYNKENASYTYQNTNFTYLNARAMKADWNYLSYFRYFFGYEFVLVENNSKYLEKNNNINLTNEDKFILENDTLHYFLF